MTTLSNYESPGRVTVKRAGPASRIPRAVISPSHCQEGFTWLKTGLWLKTRVGEYSGRNL